MSLGLEVGWDRPASTGDSEHWLAVTFRGVRTAGASASFAVLVDTSTSMIGERLAHARTAVAALVRACRPADRVAVFSFASEVTRVAEVSGGDDIADALGTLAAGGKTRLDLAMAAAAAWLETRSGPRHVVVLTDGDPTDADGRRAPIAPILDGARSLGSHGVRTSVIGLGSAENYDASFLRSLADAGGGPSAVGVAPARLVEQILGALRSNGDDSDVVLTLDSTELEVLEAWRVLPRVQPLTVVDQRVALAASDGGVVAFHVRLLSQLASAKGPRTVGTLRAHRPAGADIGVPLVLNIVAPNSPERTRLEVDVDRLRVRVELARTAQLRAADDDPEDQVRHTRRLSDLVQQLGDPRATARIAGELLRLAEGGVLGRDDQEKTVDLLRDGGKDA